MFITVQFKITISIFTLLTIVVGWGVCLVVPASIFDTELSQKFFTDSRLRLTFEFLCVKHFKFQVDTMQSKDTHSRLFLVVIIIVLLDVIIVGNCFQLSPNSNNNMPPNQGPLRDLPPLDGASDHSDDDVAHLAILRSPDERRIRCAILGCGMMASLMNILFNDRHVCV